jgi:hypothetical protein
VCWPGGGASGVEEGGLGEKDEGALVDLALPGGLGGGGDLGEGAAEVDGGRAGALRGAPGDRLGEGPINLEDPGAVAIARELAAVALGETGAGHLEGGTGGQVEEDGIGGSEFAGGDELVEGADPGAGHDLAAVLAE